MTVGSLWRPILGAWVLASLVVVATTLPAIASWRYGDPDDIMRLLEVRDLLNGQSWWDVSQHRLASGLMHWSRLVDLPLAMVELPLRPLYGQAVAERAALIVVPLFTLLIVMALGGFLTQRLLDDECARAALLIAPLSVPILCQLRPMRIDHHGWQIALSLAALLALVARPTTRSGIIGGAMLALLLTISLEGLPIAAALLGILALSWLFQPERASQVAATAGTLFGGAVLLQAATRGPAFLAPACDAMSPVWLAILGTMAFGIMLATRLPEDGIGRRFGALAATALACIPVLLAIDLRCAAGPFANLDPVVRSLWYDQVSEGLPIWEQLPIWAAMTVGLPIVGLVGGWLAMRRAPPERKDAWRIVLAASACAFALSLVVSRAAGTANAFALPGAAWLLTTLLSQARLIPNVIKRTAATAGALLVAAPGLAAVPLLGFPEQAAAGQPSNGVIGRRQCARPADARAVHIIPPATLFAPIDIAPEIIAATSHHAITSGHHRNGAAMHDIVAVFTGSPDQAHRIILRYRSDYVVACPGLNETELYRSTAPGGFWARLERGERFDWLQPVSIPGSPVLAWRVVATRLPD